MNILVLNGPNLNMQGIREPDLYGSETLDELMSWLANIPDSKGYSFKFFQSNHEGEIIDTLHNEREWAQGIIINPGAFAHYSYAIRDAISAVGINTVEVHLTDIDNRENFRKISVISAVCLEKIVGLGKFGYKEALNILTNNSIK